MTWTRDAAARRRDAAGMRRVGLRRRARRRARRRPRRSGPHRCRVLADAGGEDEAVQPAERRGQRADVARDAMDEDLDGEARRAARARQQVAEVGGDAGQAEHAGAAVEQVLHLRGVMPSWCIRCSTTAGSSSPQRVPIGRPSSAEKPIVVATLRPARSAQSEAPLPRCATTTRPLGDRRRDLRQDRGDVFVGQPVKAVAAHAALRPWRAAAQRPAPPPAWCGERRCRSRRPAAGRALRSSAARIGARLCGWCSGASGEKRLEFLQQRRRHALRRGRAFGPPCTTRCPSAASGRPPSRSRSQGSSAAAPRPGSSGPAETGRAPATAAPARVLRPEAGCTPMPSTWPRGGSVVAIEEREFQRGGAGIDDADDAGLSLMPRAPAGRRPTAAAPARRRRGAR